ncbi:HAD-IA family hydrolase [Legionella geestiana]|uniref:HAD family hydrolase n=1 Tax=Legionella geestiana TaxID=45065 RepID=UPI0010918CEF|nr:HAD-IA family hydrolase [Legionella geestiana]QDQ40372.1 HAD-IA family hydrolase [Legionella geestiana]
MGNSRRLVVFDWEGTLADTLGETLNTVACVAGSLGLGDMDMAHARQCAGLGLVAALRRVFPGLSLHQQEQLLEAVQYQLNTRGAEVCLFPGARELLARLQHTGVFLAIASNKGQQSLMRAIQNAGLSGVFTEVRSASTTAQKPAPDMLQELMDAFAVSPGETLMVGDSVNDILMAASLGVDSIGMDFYHLQEADLRAAGAFAVFDSHDRLAAFLQLPE